MYRANHTFASWRNESGPLHANWCLWCLFLTGFDTWCPLAWRLQRQLPVSLISFALLLLDSILTPWKGHNSKIHSCLEAELPKYFSPNIRTIEPACRLMYLILNKLNQGCVELNFFVQRKMWRGTTDITAYMYGYNISSQLVSKKQAHQAKFFCCCCFFVFFFVLELVHSLLLYRVIMELMKCYCTYWLLTSIPTGII